jgi:hypothetical protein
MHSIAFRGFPLALQYRVAKSSNTHEVAFYRKASEIILIINVMHR